MRWYRIEIGDGSSYDATGNASALNVEFDIPVAPQTQPKGSAFVRVWGIPLQTILTARNLNNKSIKVYGGMQTGLPLANPALQGLLVQGQILPALGNWVGVDMTLDLNIVPGVGQNTSSNHANVIHNWPAESILADAIKQTLTTAFPKLTPVIQISQKLKLSYADTGFYQTLDQYATYINNISHTIMNDPKYFGVHMTVHGDKILVTDHTQPSSPKQVQPQDLVGQPIWTGLKTAQWKTIMRGDFVIGDKVTMPASLATLSSSLASGAGGAAPGAPTNLLQGSFNITAMRHTGNFRQADGMSWVTVFDGVQA